MRQVHLKDVNELICKMAQDANYYLAGDVLALMKNARQREESDEGRDVLDQIIQNAEIASRERVALCQDTGVSVVHLEVGEEVEFVKDGFLGLRDAVTKGVAEGHKTGFLRFSIVGDPLGRKNTGDNTPAFIHTELAPGDHFKVTFMSKGGGCENMSQIRMFSPSAGAEGAENFVVEAIEKAGPNPCPPIIVGVGIGGNFEKCAMISKKALFRQPCGSANPDSYWAEMEKRLLERINKLGIGPQGMGGRITALAVHVEAHPCHIASLPVAVNIDCHSHRVRTAVL